MAEKSKEDICADSDIHAAYTASACASGLPHVAAPGQRVQVGCDANCQAFVEKLASGLG